MVGLGRDISSWLPLAPEVVSVERESHRFALLDDDYRTAVDCTFEALDVAEIIHLNDAQ